MRPLAEAARRGAGREVVRRIVVDEFADRDFDSDDKAVHRIPFDTPQWRDVRIDVADAVAGGMAGLAGMSYAADSAGPFAPVNALTTQAPIPTYLVNDWRREVVVVHRIEPRQPLGLPVLERRRVQVPGVGGPGRHNTPGVDDPLTTR